MCCRGGNPMKWFVAVSGNIGSGKSTITTLLSERLGWLNALGARWRGYGSREPGENDVFSAAGQP